MINTVIQPPLHRSAIDEASIEDAPAHPQQAHPASTGTKAPASPRLTARKTLRSQLPALPARPSHAAVTIGATGTTHSPHTPPSSPGSHHSPAMSISPVAKTGMRPAKVGLVRSQHSDALPAMTSHSPALPATRKGLQTSGQPAHATTIARTAKQLSEMHVAPVNKTGIVS